MSRLLRTLRESRMSPQQQELLKFLVTGGQYSSLPPDIGADPIGDPAADYLDGPSMADILLKNAKAMAVHDMLRQARSEDGNPRMAPMIASIGQLDR